jgi:hypothetical protein
MDESFVRSEVPQPVPPRPQYRGEFVVAQVGRVREVAVRFDDAFMNTETYSPLPLRERGWG